MPSVSKKQQRLFGMVHAYQTGKIPSDKVSGTVKKIAKTISPKASRDYAKTTHKSLDEILREIVNSPKYIELTLAEINESKTPAKVKGVLVDVFTAQLLLTVLGKLNEQNKNSLLTHPINEMVAMSYKILTY